MWWEWEGAQYVLLSTNQRIANNCPVLVASTNFSTLGISGSGGEWVSDVGEEGNIDRKQGCGVWCIKVRLPTWPVFNNPSPQFTKVRLLDFQKVQLFFKICIWIGFFRFYRVIAPWDKFPPEIWPADNFLNLACIFWHQLHGNEPSPQLYASSTLYIITLRGSFFTFNRAG